VRYSPAKGTEGFEVIVTMRYAHPNLDSKRSAVAKLEGFGDTLHQNAATGSKVSPKFPLKAVASYT
jgi:hypothetical protein